MNSAGHRENRELDGWEWLVASGKPKYTPGGNSRWALVFARSGSSN